MKKRDLVNEISSGTISEKQAELIVDNFLDDSSSPSLDDFLVMSTIEWTAYASGASLGDIASWRRDGWPTHCFRCGKPLDLPNFGWTVAEDTNGTTCIRHVGPKCPD